MGYYKSKVLHLVTSLWQHRVKQSLFLLDSVGFYWTKSGLILKQTQNVHIIPIDTG